MLSRLALSSTLWALTCPAFAQAPLPHFDAGTLRERNWRLLGSSAPVGRAWMGTALFLTATTLGATADGNDAYREEVLRWREERETTLRAESGWLAVRGLFWLKEGTNRFGTDPNLQIVLPEGSTVGHAGAFEHHDGKTTVFLEPGADVTSGATSEAAGAARELKPDSREPQDTLRLGRLTMQVIERGGRHGVRLRDPEAPTRREFPGLRFFPVDASQRVTARFVPYDPPKLLAIANVIGQVSDLPSPGRAIFTLAGRELSLEPVLEAPDAQELFFIFRDETSGRETYGAGRFLYSALPKDDTVVLDFNKAYSPPCAFTAHATCPLPPRQNALPVSILAGEKDPGGQLPATPPPSRARRTGRTGTSPGQIAASRVKPASTCLPTVGGPRSPE